ncbi:MAG: DUF4157 domain-containing protein [Anaerolineae bacterium]|nr:DUF4157 domain-containing protein [Anaerolineae bacterium]
MKSLQFDKLKPHATPVSAILPAGVLQRKCACGGAPGFSGECHECQRKRMQTKSLLIGSSGNALEREADRVAESIVSGRSGGGVSNLSPVQVQRAGAGGQQSAGPASSGLSAPSLVNHVIERPGQSLDPGTRTFMERRFGHDFSRVRIHSDDRAAESAGAMNALAYTVGTDIVFGSRQFAPQTHFGKRLLAHELTHVLQQGQQPGLIQRYGMDNAPWGDPERDVRLRSRLAALRSTITPRDITVLDWGENWNPFNLAGGILTLGEIDASGVRDMVDQIKERIPQQTDCIRELTIIGHGSPGRISVGDGTGWIEGANINGGAIDPSSPTYDPAMRAMLAELTPLFCSSGSVTLRGCNVGDGTAGAEFVQQLADLWGVPVQAHVGTVRGGGYWTTGDWTSASPVP